MIGATGVAAADNLPARRWKMLLGVASWRSTINEPRSRSLGERRARVANFLLSGAYLGLTPRRYQSGEVDTTGRDKPAPTPERDMFSTNSHASQV